MLHEEEVFTVLENVVQQLYSLRTLQAHGHDPTLRRNASSFPP